ncbi:hypothetical protein Q4Q39_05015 [Flavivirga amylovorans]|uniref:Uncharacterized protein n=1 Tax=Flavivirga amylovorans TaxID=870486 RepID=A0ABT8WYJ9_9FLAO|nr:hypothetical protein [Flavivirga amylovorans]MDO5986763.1 hypothetical protein [Flavivirga amylovorans]
MYNTTLSIFELIKIEPVKSIEVYNRFINWVTGEFDLYLKNKSKELKVYFPNGWFSIGCFKNENQQINIKIKVKGKSKIACQKIMNQLELIYHHVLRFTESNNVNLG